MKAYLSLAFLIWSLFSIPTLAGGPPSSLKLMDAADKKPIEGVTFHYGDQHGISDPAGMITLSILENQSLVFSHIAYGTWTLSDGELADAVKAGVLYRAQRPIEVQPVTVIHVHPRGEDVEQLALDVEDKLSHDAGAILNQNAAISSIRKSGSYGFDPVFRGFKYDQLNLVIDGAQCATAACPNRMDPPASQVAPNMMERVEILKGPHSFRYGTAFGGTVNFESAPLSFSERPQVYGRWSGSSESNGGIYRTEGMGGFRGNRYNLNLFGSFSNGEDYEDGGGVAVPARFQRASAGARLGVSVTENQDLTLSITHNNAQDTQFPALPMDLRSDKTWLFNARYEGRFSGGALSRWSTTAFATSVDHLMDNLDKVLVPRMMDARTDATTLNYGGRSETTWMLGYARLYAGLDLRVEKAEGDRTRSFLMGPMAGRTVYDNVWNGGEVAKAGAFGEYHRAFDDFRMVMSGRLEVNKSRATDLNEGFAANNGETDQTQINPNLSIGAVRDFNRFSVGLWAGHARRSASITERFINSFPVGVDAYDMLGNPELDPEINNQIDLTVGYKSERSAIDFTVFGAFLKNYISSEIDPELTPTMPSSPGVRRYININQAFMSGVELGWQQQLFAGIRHHFSMAYTYGENRVSDTPLPEIAPLDLRYLLSGELLGGRLRPALSLRHVLKQDRVSQTFGETETPAFSLIDLTVTAKMMKNLGATLGVRNLTDEAYYEHLSRADRGLNRPLYAPGRSFYLTVFVDVE